MHEHTPGEEAPEPTEETEAADPVARIPMKDVTMRLRTWSVLLVLLTACASAPAPRSMPRPHAFASTPTSGPRILLVSAPVEPTPQRSWIGKADLDKARALLSRAREDIEPRQWEQLDRELTAAERAFERFSRAARTSGQAAEVAEGRPRDSPRLDARARPH